MKGFAIIVGVLIAIIIGEVIQFNSKLKVEEQKTSAFLQENFNKGPDNQASIQVKISENTPEGQFNDSIYYTPEQWAAKTPADIAADKKARVDNWLKTIKAAKAAPPYVPTKEELQRQADELQAQLDGINEQIQ
ncbi:MAG: hypothetical protein WCS97_01025 [Candidatus Paceibacterota bacterium]|jgi:hypothetical protein